MIDVMSDPSVILPKAGPHLPSHCSSLTEADFRAMWPTPSASDDKYSRGVVGIDTGSARYPGAAVLSTLGALRAGAGFVRYCGCEAAQPAILARCPSVTFGRGRVGAWVVGCGWDDEEMNVARLAGALVDAVPCVIDAGALWVIDDALQTLGMDALPPGCLLTPHAGELARLLGVGRDDVLADPVGSATEAARRTGAAVLLKGSAQYCATPDGTVLQALPGPAWTAQAGSGDVLAGVAGTLLAAGLDSGEAGALAASLQALAASRHPGPWAPDQLADMFPSVVNGVVG